MSPLPMVSAICLTRNRRDFLVQAIEDFNNQDWPSTHRELVIVNDSNAEDVGDLAGENIRIVNSSCGTIGTKRNVGVSSAVGEVIVTWDDDDRYHPGRISHQLSHLRDSEKSVLGYYEFITENSRGQRWVYSGQTDYACGVSLCYFREWGLAHPFATIQIGEDNLFIAEANKYKQFSAIKGEEYIITSMHAGNTSPRQVHNTPWRKLVPDNSCYSV